MRTEVQMRRAIELIDPIARRFEEWSNETHGAEKLRCYAEYMALGHIVRALNWALDPSDEQSFNVLLYEIERGEYE